MSSNNFSKNFESKNNKTSNSFYPLSNNNCNSLNKSLVECLKNKEIKSFYPKKMRKNEKPESCPDVKLNKDAKIYIPTKNRIYTYEFLIRFENAEDCNKTNLLDEESLRHISEMEKTIKEYEKSQSNKKNKSTKCSTSESINSSALNASLSQWGRKDYTKEVQAAEENKKIFEENDKKDNAIKELRGIMNVMTKDNYDEEKIKILQIIENDLKLQEQFLQILYKKVIMESAYIDLYGELCKFLNKKLHQKSSKNEKSSIFREKLIDKCREILKATDYNKYVDEQEQQEKENKIKKLNLGNINLLIQLVKIKMLSKKIVPDCFNHLIKKYQIEEKKFLKVIYAQAIVSLTDKYAMLINSEKDNLKSNEYLKYVEDFFKNLEKIKNDTTLPGHIKYLIINLIEKKKNNYKLSKTEKSRIAKSKKELEEENLYNDNEEETTEEENQEEVNNIEDKEEDKEKEKEKITDQIKNDLSEYKNYVDENGNSNKYPWITTTKLYDKELKSFDDILEGFIIASVDIIDNKRSDIKYVKEYIKELISFYQGLMEDEEKCDLRKKVFSLLELVSDYALDTPDINDVYSYVLFLFIENGIMKIKDLKNIYTESNKDTNIVNKVLKSICQCNKSDEFKKELRKIGFIVENKGAFEWVFSEQKKG